MVTWDDALQDCQDFSGDSSSNSLTFFKRQMNKGYKIILAELDRPTQERTLTAPTNTLSVPLAYSDRTYMLPNDVLWPRSVKLLIGSRYYTLLEEESQEIWDSQTAFNYQGISTSYFVKERFGVGGLEILLDPIPAAGYTIEIVYEATDKNLSQLAYSTGTISLNQGSKSVTGSGTTFTTGMTGRYLNITDPSSDGQWYRITGAPSATSLTLENVYQGNYNLSNVTYSINEVFNIPEDVQQAPHFYAMSMYYALKKDTANAQTFMAMFSKDLADSKGRWAKKTDTNLIRSKRFSRWSNATPVWFPDAGIS